MKYLLIIGDGMADNPVPALGDKTPLEVADKPVIDDLARRGVLGSTVNCPKEFEPGSATAIMSIFGASPLEYYHGRGPLEAAAQGIELADGDMACRCNMVALEDGDMPYAKRRILSHSAGSIDGPTSDALVTDLWASPEFAALAKEYDIEINPGSSFRHFAVMHHADIDGISLIPPHDHLGEVIGPLAPSGCAVAEKLEKLQEAAFRFLDHHPLNEARRAAGKMPANGIWFWAEGTAAILPDFKKKYGHTGEVVSAVPLVRGIARLSGLPAPWVEGATGEIDTNWDGKYFGISSLHGRELPHPDPVRPQDPYLQPGPRRRPGPVPHLRQPGADLLRSFLHRGQRPEDGPVRARGHCPAGYAI